jgi:RNA polymerase sigma-70 factor (ECF subfamily)
LAKSQGHRPADPLVFRINSACGRIAVSPLAIAAGADECLENNYGGLLGQFQRAVLPHVDAAYKLARWLTRRDQDAEDVMQEAYLRAFRFFGSFHGSDGRTWLLAIVRNTFCTWLKKNRPPEPAIPFDAERHDVASGTDDPEARLLRTEAVQILRDAVDALPKTLRQVLVLRELEGLSYKEIAHVAGIPPGTVMSRLARGRERLQQLLHQRMPKGFC